MRNWWIFLKKTHGGGDGGEIHLTLFLCPSCSCLQFEILEAAYMVSNKLHIPALYLCCKLKVFPSHPGFSLLLYCFAEHFFSI